MARPFKLKSGNSPLFKNMGSSPAKHSSWKVDDMGIAHNEMYPEGHTNEDHPLYWTPISEYSEEQLADLKEDAKKGRELIEIENEKTRIENEKKEKIREEKRKEKEQRERLDKAKEIGKKGLESWRRRRQIQPFGRWGTGPDYGGWL